MRLLLLVVLAAALASPGRAQLFPFSSLHSYFKSVSAGGPGADAAADVDADAEAPAEAGEVRAFAPPEPSAAAAEAVPSQELRPPPNHRLEEDAQPAEAAPVVGLLRPASFPSQVLQPPSTAPALDYASLLAAAPSPLPAASAAVAFAPSFSPAASAAPAPTTFAAVQPSLVLMPPPASSAFPKPTAAPTPAAAPKAPLNHKSSALAAYPKKYRPEHEKSPQKVAGGGQRAPPKKKNAPPKKASAAALSKEQLQFKQQQRLNQHVAATVEAAAFQKPAPRPAGAVEQEAAESGFAGVTAGVGLGGHDRVEFQMHGQHGPHSYKWGYDTGKGHNRQFRYEERDAHGHVKGHYGFYDKHGKLQVVSYSADPEHGYHADGNFGKHSIA